MSSFGEVRLSRGAHWLAGWQQSLLQEAHGQRWTFHRESDREDCWTTEWSWRAKHSKEKGKQLQKKWGVSREGRMHNGILLSKAVEVTDGSPSFPFPSALSPPLSSFIHAAPPKRPALGTERKKHSWSFKGLRVDKSIIYHHPVGLVLQEGVQWVGGKEANWAWGKRTRKEGKFKEISGKEASVCKGTECPGSCWESGLVLVEGKMQDKLSCHEQRPKHN